MSRKVAPALFALALSACGRACGAGGAPDAGLVREGGVAADLAPACTQRVSHALGGGRPVVVGAAVRAAHAFYVGAVVGGGDGVVLRLEDGKAPETVPVATFRGDAPAPLPIVDGDVLLVAYRASDPPGLVVRPLAETAVRWRVAVPPAEDVAFDIAISGGRGLAVFEEPHARGDAVKAVVLGASGGDGGAPAPIELRAATHDVDGLRVVRAGASYWVLWLARTLEVPDADVVEGTRDREGPAFVEAVRVDADGKPHGVSPVTPPGGRVTGFDVRAVGEDVEVVLRDADIAPREILFEGAGRATPALVELGPLGLVQLSDASEHPLLLRLGDKGRVALPFEEGRDVRAVGLVAASSGADLLAVALGPHGGADLRVFSCPMVDAGR
jgi:hypothetical protein